MFTVSPPFATNAERSVPTLAKTKFFLNDALTASAHSSGIKTANSASDSKEAAVAEKPVYVAIF